MIEGTTIADRLADADLGAYFRPCDAEAAGISYRQLRRMEGLGLVEREGWGLYRRTHADITRHHTLAAVCARVSQAVVCLLTALEVHDIGSQKPRHVWIAIPHKARVPTLGRLPVRITRFSSAALTYGVEDTAFEGVPARITTPTTSSKRVGATCPWSSSRATSGSGTCLPSKSLTWLVNGYHSLMSRPSRLHPRPTGQRRSARWTTGLTILREPSSGYRSTASSETPGHEPRVFATMASSAKPVVLTSRSDTVRRRGGSSTSTTRVRSAG